MQPIIQYAQFQKRTPRPIAQNIIFTLRKSMGINQKEFARLVRENVKGVSTHKVEVSRWENGYHYPNLPIIRYIANLANKTEREIRDNLTSGLRPSVYTLDGKLKRELGRNPKQEAKILNQSIEDNQMCMY